MSRKIIYVGLERCDFIYHLATILSLKANKVIVVDDSISKDLFNSVCKETDTNVYEWRNIIFAKDVCLWESDEIKDADYVIGYAGMNPEHEFKKRTLDESESIQDKKALWLIMPDYTFHGVEHAIHFDKLENDETLYILRDFCTKKITDKSLAMLLQIDAAEIVGHISLSDTDMAAYVALTHNGHQNIKGISSEMTEALTYLVAKLYHIGEKEAKKEVALARKIRR